MQTDRAEQNLPKVTPGLVAGLVILSIGTVLLLDRLGFVDADAILRYWPALVVAAGLAKVFHARESAGRLWGGLIAAAGLAILAHRAGYLQVDWNVIWPLALIAIGVSLVVRALQKTRSGEGVGATALAVLNEWSVFGGGHVRNRSKAFRGGEVLAVFGGYEVDLTDSEIAEGSAVIDANAMFGGVEIRVPETWTVQVKGAPIFGGYADKTRRLPRQADLPDQNLIVRGLAIFGGVEVKN